LIPEAGRRIAAAGIELTHQLTPGELPEPPKAKPFAAPWNYGNVPAETK
jgi:neutral ceramidase